MYFGWKPYVRVAERRRKARKEVEKARRNGERFSPVTLGGRAVARTFWGKAWCQNLERYSDYANRLPRGRSYVRNGAVIDLRIGAGVVAACVCGSSLYKTTVTVSALPEARWQAIAADCAGSIDSLVELMQGRLSRGVMERICREGAGLFPAPKEIAFDCSCPDWAAMCKHVAAVLYGVGARLDEAPELLFTLRKVDAAELVARAGEDLPLAKKAPAAKRLLDHARIAEVFGIEMAGAATPSAPAPRASKKKTARKIATKAAKKTTRKAAQQVQTGARASLKR
ncbi:MAG: SWIM zinc finger family protein [Betaproteobacteria bacterium]